MKFLNKQKRILIFSNLLIYHESNLMAAKFVNSIINNVDEWWQKRSANARKVFGRKYAYKSSNYLNHWKNSLNIIKNDS